MFDGCVLFVVVVCCLLCDVCGLLFAVCLVSVGFVCLLFVVWWLLLVVCCSLFVRMMFVVCWLLCVARWLLFDGCCLLFAGCVLCGVRLLLLVC